MALIALLACAMLWVCGKVTVFLVTYWQVTEVYRQHNCAHSFSFRGYLYYRLAKWFVWSDQAPAKVTLGIFFMFVLTGAVLYCLLLDVRAATGLWKIFVWLVSPDGGDNEKAPQGAAVGAVMSLGGLFIFALVLTFLQDSFNSFLDNLKVGRSPVMESQHVVIVGYTPHTALLIQEMCTAFSSMGGTRFAVLSEEPKPDVEEAIRQAGLDLQGSQIVVRCGVPHDVTSLQTVAVDTCSTVILSPRHDMDNELADAYMMRMLLLLQGNNWPLQGKIILSCRLMRNQEHFKRIGGGNVTVVMIDRLLGQLMWQCSRGCGLGMAVQSLLGFRGSEFYVEPVPDHLLGKTIAEATLHYPNAILAGIAACANNRSYTVDISRGGDGRRRRRLVTRGSFIIGSDSDKAFNLKLLPDKDRKLQAGDELLLLAEEESNAVASDAPCYQATPIAAKLIGRIDSKMHPRSSIHPERTEHIVVLGWNERMFASLLLEIEKSVPSGSQVYVFAPQPIEDREKALTLIQQRALRQLTNVTVKQLSGSPESLYQLEHMEPPIEEATRIFALRDQEEASPDKADTRTLFSILHVRHILQERGDPANVPVVPELVDVKTGFLCQHQRFLDYVNASDLEAAMLATVALDPRVAYFLQAITTKGGGLKFTLRGLEEYLATDEPAPASVSFFDASSIVSAAGDLLVGWTTPGMEAEGTDVESAPLSPTGSLSGEKSVIVNPPNKGVVRPWLCDRDKLMVLARRK